MVLFFSGSAISRRFVKVLEPGTAVGSNPVSVVAKMFVGWLTVRGGRLLVVGCREYLIIVGSIPNGAGTMVLWLCSFLVLETGNSTVTPVVSNLRSEPLRAAPSPIGLALGDSGDSGDLPSSHFFLPP